VIKRLAPPVVGIVVFLTAWEGFVRVFHVRRFILDAPSRALAYLFQHHELFDTPPSGSAVRYWWRCC
jgi:ABC-type nitrate/sulfonate/bicarbonate transport system permease component